MAKKIILFADGTGNAFFKQESNIWRLFDALDTSQNDQIAYYIEGVGTSSFRPWAMFDGATGVGAPENIRKLYRFLCWNWEKNDEIYMFGFSRGAFTIRTLIELIKTEGLVPKQFGNATVSHAEMERNAMAAWRAYRRKSSSWTVPILGRLVRDLVLFIWHGIWRHRRYRALYWSSKKRAVTNATVAQKRVGDCIPIKFVGLFDTVEAFGVPLESLRSAIDKLVWPISFPIEDMSDKVSRVRHALSIDDERTTFHPIRIKREKKLEKSISEKLLATSAVRDLCAKIQRKGAAPHAQTTDSPQDPDRVREVWFAGVHSDIGGGYPDSQLAHIPLVWMLEEIREADRKFAKIGQDSDRYKQGLRFRPGAEEDFRNASSPYGTLHDSRGGTGVFYRYSPRRIETKGNGTDSIHDVVVHHSAMKRIRAGSDNYAPVNLPHDAKVLRADQAIVPLKEYLRSTGSGSWHENLVSEYQQKQEHLLNLVFRRQACYFLLLFMFLAIVFMPVWDQLTGSIADSLFNSADDRLGAFFGSVAGALKYVTPSYIGPYIGPYLNCLRRYPVEFLFLIGLIFWFYLRGNALRYIIRDQAREIWKPSTEIKPKSRWRLFRVHRKLADSFWNFYRKVWTRIYGLDLAKFFSVVAVGMGFALVIFLGSIGLSRIGFNFKLGTGKICINTESGLRLLGSDDPISIQDESNTRAFTTRNTCWASGIAVEKGIAYRLRIDINPDDPWFDGPIMSDVGGFENDVFFLKLFKSPFLRWPSAGWFQPIARIGNTGDVEWPLVSNDGSGPIPADGAGCKTKQLEQDNGERTLGHMPQSYLDTAEFCEAHKSSNCAEERRRAETAINPPLLAPLGPSQPLSKDDLSSARKAWNETKGKWHLNGGSIDCQSSYPRKTLVSDFVAQKSGEFFLFVNDAMPLLLGANDTHYRNNSGSAKVTLKRAPLFSTIARVQKER